MPERWTRTVLRFRFPVLICWLAIVVLGVVAATRLTPLLSDTFSVPGTDSDRARIVLAQRFGERPDGVFQVVFRVSDTRAVALRARLARRVATAARAVPTGKASALQAGAGVLYAQVSTTLDLQHAKRFTPALREALRGAPRALVTGQPAIEHDLEPLLSADLRRGEAIAIPAALLVLVAIFGLSLAVIVPFALAAGSIALAMIGLDGAAHLATLVGYVTNVVTLIGLGLAVDYSLLVVHRFREELGREGMSVDDAIVRTMKTAGRSVAVSGVAVGIGLALLMLVPVPFVRALGLAGLLIPVASIAAAATLQPALLAVLGRRAARAHPAFSGLRGGDRFWGALAGAVQRWPWRFVAGGAAVMVVAATPAVFLRVTPGSLASLPAGLEASRGLTLLNHRVGAGVLTPTQVVVDTGRAGGALSPPVRAAVRRLSDLVVHDPEAFVTASGVKPPYVDASRQVLQVVIAGRHEAGAPAERSFVRRLRDDLIPGARFPAGISVWAGGAPPQGADFVSRAYGSFPWLVLCALGLTYVVLLRAFRSLVLPLKAVVLNLLSVAAVYGLLELIFRTAIDAWVPIVLFAVLFGLSMDYEVFLVTRMREAWDELHDTSRAVAIGLQRTGGIVTAAALVMVAAFSGFVAGRVQGLQEFGVGLSLAVLLDATVVRACLVPALMTVLDRWNWWLPGQTGRGGGGGRLPRVPGPPT